jgi:hypothetical protein
MVEHAPTNFLHPETDGLDNVPICSQKAVSGTNRADR